MGAELRLAMDGARESLPLLPAIVPFAALFGALASAAGLVALRFQPVWTVATAVAAVAVLRGVS